MLEEKGWKILFSKVSPTYKIQKSVYFSGSWNFCDYYMITVNGITTSPQTIEAAVAIPGLKWLAFSTESLLENNWSLQISTSLKTQVAMIWNLLSNTSCCFEASLKTHQPAFTSSFQQVITCSRAYRRTSSAPHSIWQASQWPYVSLVVTKIHFTHC